MRISILLVFALFIVHLGISQDHDVVILINPANSFASVSQPDVINDSQTPEIPDNDPITNMFVYKKGQTPVVYADHILIARFYDRSTQKLLKLKEFDEMKIEIFLETPKSNQPAELESTEALVTITREDEQMGMTDFNIYLETELPKGKAPHLARLRFEVSVSDAELGDYNKSFYADYFVSSLSYYNSFGSQTYGFWVPTLLFSSNLKQTANGIPFASLPVGLAWGVKYNTKNGQYLGLSLMGNWLVYTEPENTSITAANSFNLQGASLGALVDITDAISLGYAYGFNFKKGGTDPGSMFVLGFGTKILGFFKKGRT